MSYLSSARQILSRVGRAELALLVGVLVLAGFLGGFIALSSEVMEGDTSASTRRSSSS